MEVKDLIRNFKKGLTCSICLGYFNNPVTVDCGHTFCTKCVVLHCREEGEGKMICPECKEIIKDLVPNSSTKNLTLPDSLQLRPYLMKIIKSLTICDKHGEKEKFFCKEDQKALCEICAFSPQHRDHQILISNSVAIKYKDKLQQEWRSLHEERQKLTTALYDLKKREVQYQIDSCACRMLVMAEYDKIRQFLWNEEYQYFKKLTQEFRDNQTKFEGNIDTLSQQKQDLQTMAMEVEDTLEKEPLEMFQDTEDILESNAEMLLQKPEIALPHWTSCKITGLKEFLMSFYRDITLDPNTANPHLIVSEDLKSVTYRRVPQDLPHNKERFDCSVTVLGLQTFSSGKHYWEVEAEHKTDWEVGVCKDSVSRKGELSLSEDIKILVGVYKRNKFFLWNPHDGYYVAPPVQKVGIFLDYERGHVAFYNAIDKSLIYKPSDTNFQSPLRPYFSTFPTNDETMSRKLIICPRSN